MGHNLHFKTVLLVMVLCAAFFPSDLSACAVCFGGAEGQAIIATQWAVVSMLGVVFLVLSSFLAFIVYLVRKQAETERDPVLEQSIDETV
ncbi:MAG: hypothetical protein SGI71_00160 [Verrucomicrobiota bacterium]|nr:hypothetical protein [Verrucomicrobiota bacterium]